MANLHVPDFPLPELVEAYERSATQNVLAALNDDIFPGYWSVCADGIGHGHGHTFPSLDGHQMTDALLRLGRVETTLLNWDYVRSFQQLSGELPIAIFPGEGGLVIGPPGAQARVEDNGALYDHWAPGNPLRALAAPTYIENADAIFRMTHDRAWLASDLPSANRAAEHLTTFTSPDGFVAGAGYYVERPGRLAWDGVAQCMAADALQRLVGLNRLMGDEAAAARWDALAGRIVENFRSRYWVGDHFAEYIHPVHGVVANHGLTDTDWAAIATGAASAEQEAILWPQLRDERAFYYGGMPTGIATKPETYKSWELLLGMDRHDLAAMGRVWYLECRARARMGDAEGIVETLRRVAAVGKASGWYWRERYYDDGHGGLRAAGPNTYCEYPANLIRIVQRFLLGVEFALDGALEIAPTVPESFWRAGFGATHEFCGRTLAWRMDRRGLTGEYHGDGPQRLVLQVAPEADPAAARATVNGRALPCAVMDGRVSVELPAGECRFVIAAG